MGFSLWVAGSLVKFIVCVEFVSLLSVRERFVT